MRAVEFEIELSGKKAIAVPDQAAELLPCAGRAKVIVLFDTDTEDTNWRQAAYQQFLREDASEDSVYDRYTEDR